MYKLKRCRPLKIVCFLLACLFLGLFVLNAAAGICALAADRLDLFSNTFTEDFTEDLYSALAARKADALRNRSVISYAVDGDGETFLAERSALQKGGTNFAFKVTDMDGKTLLENYVPEKTLASYTHRCRVDYYADGSGGLYVIYDDDSPTAYYEDEPTFTDEESSFGETTLPAEAEPTAQPEAGTTEPPGTEPTSAPEETTAVPEATTAAPVETTTTAPIETTAAPVETTAAPDGTTTAAPETGRVNTDPVDRNTEDVYIQDDTAEGYQSILMYIYPLDEGINDTILEHCQELYHKRYEPKEAQYYQSGAYEVYHQTDFAVSGNGTAYFIGAEREPYSTETAPQPVPVKTEYYDLTVSVDAALGVKDIAWYASKGIGFAAWYLKSFVSLTVFFGIAALFFTVFSLCLAGYVKDEDAPAARGIHKLPTDLLFLVFAALIAVFGVLLFEDLIDLPKMYDTEMLIVSVFCLPCVAVGLFCCVYVFAVKLKTHTAVSSILLVRLFRWCVKTARKASNAMNVLWKLGIVYAAGGILGVFLLVVFREQTEFLLIFFLLFKVLELAFYVLLAINLHTLQKGAKDLAGGMRTQVDTRGLFGEFRKHAGYLNSIGDGINAAVEQRVKSENTKTELITNVSHDLKTPLTSIVNYIDLLKKEPVDNPKAQEYIAVIDRQSQRLKKLTTDIVDASKAAAGSVQMNMEPTDLKVLLGQVKGEYAEKLEKQGLTLVESVPEEKLTVLADGRLLWRVFDNLMNNICKYSQPDTRVYLTLAAENGTAKAVFRNISATPLNMDAASLTDRFVRGDASRNTEGSGLGLYIAKSLCETMGGRMQIDIDGDLFKVTILFGILS